MTWPVLLATVLLSQAAIRGSNTVRLTEARAAYFASVITSVSGDDPKDAAAMAVNLIHESGFNELVETCAIPGIGGWGPWGVGLLWEKPYPGATCGPVGRNAKAAHEVLFRWNHFDPSAPIDGFGAYRGVLRHRRPTDRETRERAAQYHRVLWELEHAACF